MFRSEVENRERQTFGSLNLNPMQLGLLQQEVDTFIVEFEQRQKQAPSTYPAPKEEDYVSWSRKPPRKNSISSIAQLKRMLSTVMDTVETGIETSAGTQLSYVPGNGLRSAAFGRYLAAVTNRWTGAAFSCPGAIALEQSVIGWMTDLFGYGPDAGGVLLSGGSMANFSATVAARCRFGDNFQNGTVYVSGNTHHSIEKACRMAGIPLKNVRRISLDDNFRVDFIALEHMLQKDVAEGLRPMMIVATAGTTDAGVIDPLAACSALARDYGAWFHVDAAYGGFFMLTDRGRESLKGIELADSITVDAHKGLFMPFGIGGLLVADRRYLRAANGASGTYLREADSVDDLPDFCMLGPELSRPNRGLELWLPLHLHGVTAFANELNRMLDLALTATDQLRRIVNIDVVGHPHLSIVCFRSAEGDELTQKILDHINDSGKVHVSSTVLDGKLTIRLAFLNALTPATIVDRVMNLIRTVTDQSETTIRPSAPELEIGMAC